MQLSNFNDFLGLFAALNLGYAGFKKFRSAIDGDILKIVNESPKIKKLTEELLSSSNTIEKFELLDPNIKNLILKILNRHKINAENINEGSKTALEIAGGFKSMFLFSFMYCLALMIAGGYQDYFQDDVINSFLFLLNFSLLYNIIILIRSFFKKLKSKKISPLIPILLFLFYLISMLAFLKYYCWSENKHPLPLEVNTGISLTIAASPFVFHFLRLYIHRITFKMKHKNNDDKCAKQIKQLEKMAIERYI